MCEELPTADALRGATDVAVADLPVAAWGAWRLGATGAGAAVFATGVLATLGDGTAGLAACAFLLATTGVFPTGFFAGTALAGAAAGAFAATFFTGAALSGAAFFATGAAFFTGVDFLVAGAVFFTGAFATVFFAGAGLATGFFAGVFTVFTALDALVALTALVALAAWTAGLAGFLAALAPPAAFLAGVLDTAELRVFFAMSFTQCSPPRRRAVIAEYDLPRQPPSEILAPSTVAGAPCARRQPPPNTSTSNRPVSRFLQWLLRQYKRWISPLLGQRCRFHPSCSDYARVAIARFGAPRGSVLAGWRLLRCQPLCTGGHDPVPDHFTLARCRAHGD